MEELTRTDFVKKLIAGDEQAFDTFVSHLAPHLRKFIMKLTGFNEPDSDELASDALLKAHKRIREFQSNRGAKITTWLFEIAKNTAIDELRRRLIERNKLSKDLRTELFEVESLNEKHEASTRVFQQELRHPQQERRGEVESSRTILYRRAFDSLSEQDQDILRMKNVMSYEEIAEREGTSLSALRVRYKRAKDRLYAAYEKEAGHER